MKPHIKKDFMLWTILFFLNLPFVQDTFRGQESFPYVFFSLLIFLIWERN